MVNKKGDTRKNKSKSLAMLQLYIKLCESDYITREEVFKIINTDIPRNLQRYLKELREMIAEGHLNLEDEKDIPYLFDLNHFDEYFENEFNDDEDFDEEENFDTFEEEEKIRLNYSQLIADDRKDKLTQQAIENNAPFIQSYNNNHYFSLQNYDKLNKKHVLVLLKLLLDTRAFDYGETLEITNDLLKHLSPEDRRKVSHSIRSEIHRFKQLVMAEPLIDRIWELNEMIVNKEILKIDYNKLDNSQRIITIAPQYITQDEFYFYIIGYINDKETRTLRIDRISDVKIVTDKVDKKSFIPTQLKKDNELGIYKNRTPLMFSGHNETIKLEYYGKSVTSILDKFPDHDPVTPYNKEKKCYTVTVHTSGTGVYMWLLSQGDDIKVISPISVQRKLKEKLQQALDRY